MFNIGIISFMLKFVDFYNVKFSKQIRWYHMCFCCQYFLLVFTERDRKNKKIIILLVNKIKHEK